MGVWKTTFRGVTGARRSLREHAKPTWQLDPEAAMPDLLAVTSWGPGAWRTRRSRSNRRSNLLCLIGQVVTLLVVAIHHQTPQV